MSAVDGELQMISVGCEIRMAGQTVSKEVPPAFLSLPNDAIARVRKKFASCVFPVDVIQADFFDLNVSSVSPDNISQTRLPIDAPRPHTNVR